MKHGQAQPGAEWGRLNLRFTRASTVLVDSGEHYSFLMSLTKEDMRSLCASLRTLVRRPEMVLLVHNDDLSNDDQVPHTAPSLGVRRVCLRATGTEEGDGGGQEVASLAYDPGVAPASAWEDGAEMCLELSPTDQDSVAVDGNLKALKGLCVILDMLSQDSAPSGMGVDVLWDQEPLVEGSFQFYLSTFP